ncbi:MAG: magnesium transporter [Pseudomonadota bacterium]|jgi:magnesium transporter
MTITTLAPETPSTGILRDAESGQRALNEIQELLHRFEVESDLVSREQVAGDESRRSLVEQLVVKQQTAALAPKIQGLHVADIAYVLEGLPRHQRELIWPLVPDSLRGEVMLELASAVREPLIEAMSREALLRMAQTLDPDDLAALADELPLDVVERVRQGLSVEEREQLRAAMSYPEQSVGARMDFDMITIRDDVTLEVVLRYLRRFDELPDHTDQVFVVDRKESLLGALPIGQLLINEPETTVSDVMRRDVVSLRPLDEAIDAAQAFQRYDLVSAPVVDEAGRLIGRLTVSEAVDVIQEESDSDVLAQAGLREEEDLFASVWDSARNRWLWLALNLCTAFFASRVIGAFEGTIEKVVALAALMPIVAGLAGNSGNQTMTLFIRSLALGQMNASNAQRLFQKELVIALLNGLVWGSIAGAFAWWLYSDTSQGAMLGLTMMLAIVLNLLIAALIAILVPLVLERFGRDPAMGSSVLLTFSTDSMGFFIFLGLATLFF